jgi:hypothetical protein
MFVSHMFLDDGVKYVHCIWQYRKKLTEFVFPSVCVRLIDF